MLPTAGVYNETVFEAIDYILDQMADSGIRVIVAFIDYWKNTDGVQQASACCRLVWLIVSPMQTDRRTPQCVVPSRCVGIQLCMADSHRLPALAPFACWHC